MGVPDPFGALLSSVVASPLLIVLAIVGFYFVVFIVNVGVGLAGRSAGDDFVVLSAAVSVAGAVVGGASPLTAAGTETE